VCISLLILTRDFIALEVVDSSEDYIPMPFVLVPAAKAVVRTAMIHGRNKACPDVSTQ